MATTNRRPNFATPAPTTAAEARRLADQLTEQETATAKAQREARAAATFDAAEAILATDAVQADEARQAAAEAWNATAADPAATLGDLLAAFTTMKATSAARAAIVAQASGVMGQVRPRRSEVSGQPVDWRHDTVDYLAPLQFADALEDVVRARVEAAARTARDDVQARCQAAGEQAARAVA